MRIAWTDTPASDKIHGEGLIFDQAAPCEPIEPVRIPLITNRPSTRVMYTCACTPGKPSIDFANYFLLFAEDVYLPREKEEEKGREGVSLGGFSGVEARNGCVGSKYVSLVKIH